MKKHFIILYVLFLGLQIQADDTEVLVNLQDDESQMNTDSSMTMENLPEAADHYSFLAFEAYEDNEWDTAN